MSDGVDNYLLLNAASALFEKVPADLDEEQKQQAVMQAEKEQLMQQKILDSSEAQGVEVAEGAVSAAITELESRYPSHQEFLEGLVRNGLNESTLSTTIETSLKVEAVMQKVAEAVTVSDDEVESFYHDNIEKFSHPELREASHILITINPQFPENTRKAAKNRVKKIAEELRKKSFTHLAMRHSECPTALEGGVLGKLPQGKLFPELDGKLFSMDEGEVSQVIESPVGFHLIRCNRIYAAGIAPLEEAAPIIREHLLQPRVKMAQKQWIKSLFSR